MNIESLSPIYGHISYFLLLLSFAVKKIFWLRTIAIIASLFTITYCYFFFSNPLWISIKWNILFIGINIIHIALLFYEKRDIKFSGHKKFLYENVFSQFSPGEFERILSFARPIRVAKNSVLIEEGIHLNELYLIASGSLGIRAKGEIVASLKPGAFAGEMSFLTQGKTRAYVWALEDTFLYIWKQDQLRSFLLRNPKFQSIFQASIGSQLIDELMVASSQKAKEGQSEQINIFPLHSNQKPSSTSLR